MARYTRSFTVQLAGPTPYRQPVAFCVCQRQGSGQGRVVDRITKTPATLRCFQRNGLRQALIWDRRRNASSHDRGTRVADS